MGEEDAEQTEGAMRHIAYTAGPVKEMLQPSETGRIGEIPPLHR